LILDSNAFISTRIENPFFKIVYPEEGDVLALIDTGYEGFLAVPPDIYRLLKLDELQQHSLRIILPNGETLESKGVYATVRITDTNASIDGLIETFDDLKEVIAGQELISNFKLVLDYCRKTVEVRKCNII